MLYNCLPRLLPVRCVCPCDSSCHSLGGYNVNCLSWATVNFCPCELDEKIRVAEEGFCDESLDPVTVAARFLNSACVPCDFRGKPAYLKCKKCVDGKTYVLLGVSCAGDVAFELDCKPLCNGNSFYTVCRVAFICT